MILSKKILRLNCFAILPTASLRITTGLTLMSQPAFLLILHISLMIKGRDHFLEYLNNLIAIIFVGIFFDFVKLR